MSNSKNTINSTKNKVLFNIPVTKEYLEQVAAALILICHSSERGVVEFFDSIFDYKISTGTVHNIIERLISEAQKVHKKEDLSKVKVGAHDEIFQGRKPILVGCCAQTNYCYLLSQEESRDGDTWGIHLLDLKSKAWCPDKTIADGGQGLRAGQATAGYSL